MKGPLVVCLITADDADLLSSTLLFTKTVRTAFPTYELCIFDNCSACEQEVRRRCMDEARADGFVRIYQREHHAVWIQKMIAMAADRDHSPLIIIDSDCIFWANCEWFDFKHVWAGFYVPEIWNEWGNCRSFSRLHTSFLWIPKPRDLVAELGKVIPESSQPMADYRGFDAVGPRLIYINRERFFYDTCSALYQAIGGDFFRKEHLDCYDHLNSSSFYHHVHFENDKAFREIHRIAKNDPTKLRGLHKEIIKYYCLQNIRAGAMPAPTCFRPVFASS